MLQRECSEFLTDVLWSIYAERWSSLPSDLVGTLDKRFVSVAQRAAFYA